MDRDGSGKVEASEFASALDRMNMKVSSAAVEALMKDLDADSDGFLDLDEFQFFGKK